MRIKQWLKFAALSLLVLVSTLSMGQVVFAATSSQTEACTGLSQFDTTQSCGSSGRLAVLHVVSVVVKMLSILAGFIGVIMVIFAGFRYITSNGEASNISRAKTALLYAAIGLFVAALAQFMVHFVLTQSAACDSSSKLTSKTSQCVSKP